MYEGHQILGSAIKQSVLIPAKKYADVKKLKTVQELQQFFPELIVTTDGTEQPINQDRKIVPKENRTIQAKRKNTYSTKSDYKKSWWSHNLYILQAVIMITKYTRQNIQYCLRSCYNFMILGIWEFKGFPDQISILPYKKKKDKEMSASQKEWNEYQSKTRTKVEHVIYSNQEI